MDVGRQDAVPIGVRLLIRQAGHETYIAPSALAHHEDVSVRVFEVEPMVVFNRGYDVNLSLHHMRIRLVDIRRVQMEKRGLNDVRFGPNLTIEYEIWSV